MISTRQFGFRRGKSTEEAVSLLTSIVSGHLDTNKATLGIFLDLAKAFDTVSIPILVRKLENLFGIRGIALNWFKSYLSNRKQCVKVTSNRSDLLPTNFGVPQGSILGPTLFIMYINDIHDSINAEVICYADDTVILYHDSTWEDVFTRAEKGMQQVTAWLQLNLLTLNAKKTKYLCFHKTKASAPNKDLSIQLHDCSKLHQSCKCIKLTKTDAIKYLGVVVDQNLNFKEHTSALSSRIRKTANILKLLRTSASVDILKAVYYALSQSLLMYCLSSWGSAQKTVMMQIERAQRSVLKTMLKKPFRYPTIQLYRESQVLSVRQLFILKTVLTVHRRIITSQEYKDLLALRVYRLPAHKTKTSFARRFSPFKDNFIYNKVARACDIKLCSVRQAKLQILRWLSTLSYDATESIMLPLL